MIRITAVLAGIAALVAFWSPAVVPDPVQAGIKTSIDDSETYRVLSALVSTQWLVTVGRAKVLVFQRETNSEWPCLPSGTPVDQQWRNVLENYRSENSATRWLVAGQSMAMPYTVVSSADIQASFRAVQDDPEFGWTGFNKKYPDSGRGFHVVSAVGFNKSKDLALVTVSHACGALCGQGAHFTLEKNRGVWQRVRVVEGLINNCGWGA